MDLECLQESMRGTKLSVNGTVYEIGADGLARGLKDDDAAKLLRFKGWRKPVSRSPVAASKPVEAPVQKTAVPVQKEAAPVKAEPKEEEWPDPSESMELSYLHKMADAYEVKYEPKTSKKSLVKRIREAMYE